MSRRRAGPFGLAILVAGVVLLLGAIAIVVAAAPANWLALYLARRTDGIVLLADAQGTIWSGSAVLALGPFAPTADAGDRATTMRVAVDGLALPGRITWTLQIETALAPVLHLTHDGVLLQPVALRYRNGGWALDAGAAALPASLLRLVGAPLNTLLPDGRCELRWNALSIAANGTPVGEGTLRVSDFALAISPVRPLGTYLMSWSSGEQGLTWQLATERGPLELQGGGNLSARSDQARVTVRVARDASAGSVAQLNALLDLIGRRGPDEAVIETGPRS